MTSHEPYSERLAAYALGALDPDERRDVEQHASTCPQCQQELSALVRVSAAVGLGVDPVAPPAGLRARALARATSQSQPAHVRTQISSSVRGRAASSPARFAWMVAAAAVVAAVGMSAYAWSLRAEIGILRRLVAEASSRAEALRIELTNVRRDSARLVRVANVISAPDVVRADLAGTGPGAGASGRAFWSPTRGLVFNAANLPAADAAHVYQLWIIRKGEPISAGLLSQSPDGSISSAVSPPAQVTEADTIAVTLEAAGPEQQKPRGAIVLAGSTKAD